MSNRFANQTVIVTGAGHGIGKQLAIDFAAEGARVAVNDVVAERAEKTVKEIQSQQGEAVAAQADVRSATQVEEMVRLTVRTFGDIDILVNNAGIYPNTPVVEMSEEEWDSVWDINVKGMFLTTRAVARHLIAAHRGSKIINMSSGAALRARIGAAHYCSSKAAISMFTKVLALELAEHSIHVNAVAPGLIEVPDWGLSSEYIERMVSITPLGRIGQPTDISRVVRFLASEEADFMTGSVVVVDGGSVIGQSLPRS